MTGSPWRFFVTPPATGAENMALDEALMHRSRAAGEWVLRVYAWSKPTVSFGRNQSARGRFDVERMRARGWDVVRRPTGGRAILHDREVTYTVTAPVADAGDLRESYERINRLLVSALDAMGVRAELAVPGVRAAPPDSTPCFAAPSAGELEVGGRKLAGSAQWRADGALLQHGSILVHDDQSRLTEVLTSTPSSLPPAATLSGVLGWTPSVRDVADALIDSVRRNEDPCARELALDDELRAHAASLVVRYTDDAWTWRR